MAQAAEYLLSTGEPDTAAVMLEKLEIRLSHLSGLREDLARILSNGQGVRKTA